MNIHYRILLTGLLYFSSPANSQVSLPQAPDTVDVEGKIFERVEVEASYPGGTGAWIKFLTKTLNADVPANRNAPAGHYTVVVQFIVNKDGTVTEIKPLTNHGYGMEQEVTRTIGLSGKWTPAVQNGRPVKAYRKQPVTFALDSDDFQITSSTLYVLFANKDNTISIDAGKVKPEDLIITLSQGTIISMGDGRYVVRALKPGRVILKLYNGKKDKEIGAASFEVREL